ncbi:alpha/beta hydrolase [Streptomyces sp. J2-1]|uniref:alpha/beta hydrolase n=1 Tax=Streptomyces corallincola TaxID=2851888 RepID=UPI001C382DF2|nr:alpha/beta hydrolase [Streptomyces corallincola]MBV2353678.1 alpha/beta hydrolase [Streptomyces corallincola]
MTTDHGLDTQATALLGHLTEVLPDGFLPMSGSPLTLREIRATLDAWPVPPGPDPYTVHDVSVPGPAGVVPVRVYHPGGEGGQRPALVWFHGGGFALGGIEQCDPLCRALAVRSGAVVMSVGYRLAPENPYPAGFDDACAAVDWAAANSTALGFDGTRLAVGGDSAGGTLAAAVALRDRDRGDSALALQIIAYGGAQAEVTNPEGSFPLLTAEDVDWFWDMYATADDRKSGYCCPMSADDLTGLPPALVLTATVDPMRDGLERYAHRLAAAGVRTTHRRFPGTFHGFLSMYAALDQGARALDDVVEALRAVPHRTEPRTGDAP